MAGVVEHPCPAPGETGPARTSARHAVLAQLGLGPGGGLHPGRVAATLALCAAALVALAAPDGAGLSIAAADLAAAALLRVGRPGRWGALAVPILLALDPAALALAGRPAGGLLVLPAAAAAYLGLCARPGDLWRLLPVLVAAEVVALGPHHLAQLPGQVLLWLLVGEVTARSRNGARRLLHEARRAAETDPLTGLGNRRRLDEALASLPEGGVVVLVDLDHFKGYNDRFGHPAGDGLLVRFAATIVGVVGPSDLACRYGGEEFVVVLPDPADAATLFIRLRTAWEESAPPVTFSAGLAVRRPGEAVTVTLQRADSALYDAKRHGRNRVAGPLLVPRPRSTAPATQVAAEVTRTA